MGRIEPGQRFGKWTAIKNVRFTRPSGRKETKWMVICECGTEQAVSGYDLNKGKTTKCKSCYGKTTKDLIGIRFGSWTVKEKGVNKNGKSHWICKCDCGESQNVCSASLTKGVSSKCLSCYKSSMPKHGYTCKEKRHPLYSIWIGMLSRCENKNNAAYKNYGARGIKVSGQWHSLDNFYNDMKRRPDGYSLDRIDNDKDYCSENCRWSSPVEQANNKRTNRFIEYNNEIKTVSQWSRHLHVKADTLFKYLERNSFEKAYVHYTKN